MTIDPRRGCVFVGDVSTSTEIQVDDSDVIHRYGTAEPASIPVVVSAANSYSDYMSTTHQVEWSLS